MMFQIRQAPETSTGQWTCVVPTECIKSQINSTQSCLYNPFCTIAFLVEGEISKEGGLEVFSLHTSKI